MVGEGGERRICSCQALLLGTTWGPFPGKIEAATGGSDKVGSLIWYEGEFKMWTFNEFMKRGIGDTFYFPLTKSGSFSQCYFDACNKNEQKIRYVCL